MGFWRQKWFVDILFSVAKLSSVERTKLMKTFEVEKLRNLFFKYGYDFFKKCKHYKTATKTLENGNLPAKVTYLGLVSFDEKTLEFEAYEAGSSIIFRVSVFDLDNFVL